MKIFSIIIVTLVIKIIVGLINDKDNNLKYLDENYNIIDNTNTETMLNIENNLKIRNLGFYIKNIYDKNDNPAIRSFIETDAVSIISKIKCIWVDLETYIIYDFYKIHNLMNLNEEDYILKNATDAKYLFSMCGNIAKKCNQQESQLSYFKNDDSSCKILAKQLENYNQWSLLDSKNSSYGVNVTLNGGETFGDITLKKKYSVNINLKCVNYQENNPFTLENTENLDINKMNNFFNINSNSVCPITFLSDVWIFIEQLKFIGMIICLIICGLGLILCFFGQKLITVTIFIFSTIFSVTIIYNITFNLLGISAGNLFSSIVYLMSVGLGIGLGYIVTKNKKIWLSVILGTLSSIIFVFLFYIIFLWYANVPMFILTILFLCVLVFFIRLYYKYLTDIFIISTAFNGSYLSIRSLSIIIGGFPSEFYIIYLVLSKEYKSITAYLTWRAYLWIIGWISLMGLGIVIQNKLRPNKDQEEQSSSAILDGKINTEEDQVLDDKNKSLI